MKLSTSVASAMALAALFHSNFVAADLVSVQGDGTFNIAGPVCSGPGTVSTPLGSACPRIGDTAVDECHPYNPSYDATSGKCVAPVPAVCKPVKGGVWGCVWDLSGLASTDNATTAPVAGGCQDVSVEGDGTFCIKGPICSGSGVEPAGSTCPQIGDTAVDDCYPYFPSYDAKTGKCVAPVPSLCKPVKSGVWGCVWDLSGVATTTTTAVTLSTASTAAESDSPKGGLSGGAVVGLVAGVAAVVAAAVLSKRKSKAQTLAMRELELSPCKT